MLNVINYSSSSVTRATNIILQSIDAFAHNPLANPQIDRVFRNPRGAHVRLRADYLHAHHISISSTSPHVTLVSRRKYNNHVTTTTLPQSRGLSELTRAALAHLNNEDLRIAIDEAVLTQAANEIPESSEWPLA